MRRGRISRAVAALCALASAACGPQTVAVDKGVDVIEIRTFATPMLIQDPAVGGRVAAPLIDAIEGLSAVAKVKDEEVRSEDFPFMRISFLNNALAGKHKVFYALVLFEPSSEEGRAAKVRINFRTREELDWNAAELPAEQAKTMLEKIDAASGRNMQILLTMSAGTLDAVRRAISKVSSVEGIFGDEIELVSAEKVEWPNTALGFEEPGMMYGQMIVPGHKIVLKLPSGKLVECHTSSDRVEFR